MRLLPILALAALAGCAESESPDAAQADASGAYDMIAPVSARIDAEESTPSIGEWRRSMQDEKAALLFGPADTEALFSIACGERGGLMLQRHGAVARAAGETMTIGRGGSARRFRVDPVEGPLPRLRAVISASDPLPAQLAETREPISIAIGDEAPLLLKSDPLVGQFVRGCSAPADASGPAPEAAAADNAAAAVGNSN